MTRTSDTLYDPHNGDLALEVADADVDAEPEAASRTNYFTVYWVRSGRGTAWADTAAHPFSSPSLLFFVPYQRIRLVPDEPVRAVRLRFHANFLCIETYHARGRVQRRPVQRPLRRAGRRRWTSRRSAEVGDLIARIRGELAGAAWPTARSCSSYLKILLVRATRLKRDQQGRRAGRRPPAATPARGRRCAN